MRLVTAHTTQALTEDTNMNSRQRYKAKRAAEHRERKEYCQKIERAFSRLSEGCSNRVIRAVSSSDSYGRQIEKAISHHESIAQRRERKLRNEHMQVLNESGRTIHAVQKSRGKSIPLI